MTTPGPPFSDGGPVAVEQPEGSGPPRRHVVLVVALATAALLTLAALAAIALTPRAGPDGDALSAPPSEGSGAGPPEPAAESTEAAASRPGRRITLDDLAEEVARIRELPLQRRLRARVVSQEALGRKVSDLAFSELDAAEVAADERLLTALRLAPPDIDLAGILEALYREQILGLYVPEERTLYVKGGRDRASAAQRITSAHEITHALQDQSFDLVALQESVEDDSEASLALLSLIEGDAVLTQQLWSEQHQTPAQRQEALRDTSTGGEALATAPEYLRNSLFFPYQHGVTFVLELYRAGGFAAIDAAYANPPTTSEQILHPDKYLAGEGADAIRTPRRPGPGWRRDATYPFGEFDLQQMMLAVGPAQATVVSEGWGGGEIRSWRRDGRTAVALALSFDTAQDAAEACDAMPRWYAQVAGGRRVEQDLYAGDRDHLAVDCTGEQVFAGLAEEPALARRLAGLD
jgi:hypothetical protein